MLLITSKSWMLTQMPFDNLNSLVHFTPYLLIEPYPLMKNSFSSAGNWLSVVPIIHGQTDKVYKRVPKWCPIKGCKSKAQVKLSNHMSSHHCYLTEEEVIGICKGKGRPLSHGQLMDTTVVFLSATNL